MSCPIGAPGTFEVDMVDALKSWTQLSDLIADRLHPVRAPWQQTYPYATYQIDVSTVQSLCETYRNGRYEVTLDIWSKDYIGAHNIRRSLLDFINTPDPRFRVKWLGGSTDGYEEDTQVYRVSTTLVFWYLD